MKRNEFVTSDTHFGHKSILKHYENRPFSSVEEMDEAIIEAWNKKVPPGATVYHLGDFCFHKPGPYLNILSRLNGNICLIRGNHDRLKSEVKERFCWIKDYYESKTEDGRKIVMCHYPLMTWNKAHYGAWHLYGHSHGNLRAPETTRMDVGIDTRDDFAPYSFEEIEKIMNKRKYLIVDHHTPRLKR